MKGAKMEATTAAGPTTTSFAAGLAPAITLAANATQGADTGFYASVLAVGRWKTPTPTEICPNWPCIWKQDSIYSF